MDQIKLLEKELISGKQSNETVQTFFDLVMKCDKSKLTKISKNILITTIKDIKKVKQEEFVKYHMLNISWTDEHIEQIFRNGLHLTYFKPYIETYQLTTKTMAILNKYNATSLFKNMLTGANTQIILNNTIFYELDNIRSYGTKDYEKYHKGYFGGKIDNVVGYELDFSTYAKLVEKELINKENVIAMLKFIKDNMKYIDIRCAQNLNTINMLLGLFGDEDIIQSLFEILIPIDDPALLFIKVNFDNLCNKNDFHYIQNLLYYTTNHNIITDTIIYHALSNGFRYVISKSVLNDLTNENVIAIIKNKKYNGLQYIDSTNKISTYYNAPLKLYCYNKVIDIYTLLNTRNEKLLEIACKYNYDDIFDDCIKLYNPTFDMYKSNLYHVMSNYDPNIIKTTLNLPKTDLVINLLLNYRKFNIYKKDYRKTHILNMLTFYNYKIDLEKEIALFKNSKIKKDLIAEVFRHISFINNDITHLLIDNNLPYPENLPYKPEMYDIYHYKYENTPNLEYFRKHIGVYIVELREMFKDKKWPVIQRYMKTFNLSIDQYCVNNAYYYGNKIVENFTLVPSERCCVLLMLKKNKVYPEIINPILLKLANNIV